MKTSGPRPLAPRNARSAGFTLFSVLLAVAVIAGLVAAYGRHVVVSGRGGMASPPLLAAREACHSGLAFARQAIVSGQDVEQADIPVGSGVASISVTQTPGGHEKVSVESFGGDGLGARREAELALQPVPVTTPTGPAALPTLDAGKLSALLAGGSLPVQHVTTATRIEHAEVSALLVVHAGIELQLADVVLHGAVVSDSVLAHSVAAAFDPDTAPRLKVDGNLRIDPPAGLPGLAILLPDGAVTTSAVDARVQIQGDVVAWEITLLDKGVLSGHALGKYVALADSSKLDRLGFDRKPPPWSSALDFGGTSEPVFLATIPASASLDSLSGIMNYWHQDGPGDD